MSTGLLMSQSSIEVNESNESINGLRMTASQSRGILDNGDLCAVYFASSTSLRDSDYYTDSSTGPQAH
jgi:hypothetical protein